MPPIYRPGVKTDSTWDKIMLGGELPGPGAAIGAAAGGTKLAAGALDELVQALRAGKTMDPAALKQLLKSITSVMGRSRGQKNLTQVPDVLNAAPLDSTLQQAVRGGGAAPFPLAPPRPMPPPGFTKPISGLAQGADDVAGQAAAGGKGFGKILAGLLGAGTLGAAGYGLSQSGGDEGVEDPGVPDIAKKLMAVSHAQGPQKAGPASGGGRKRLGLPPLPGIQTGVPQGLGESFGTPSDDSLAMEEEVLQGRNPAAGNSFFDATGGRSSQNALLGNMTEQQLDPKKKSLLQALLGGLGKVF